MANGYDPHMCYMLNAAQGTARSTFDLRLEPGSHGYCEWRDWSVEPYITGPSLTFLPDGSLQVNKQTLLTLPHAQWIRFEIACPLGEAAKGTWDLTVTVPGKKPERFAGLACKPEFRKITWVGYSSLATDAQVFFLDNLKLSWK